MATEQDILKTLDRMEAALTKAASTPGRGGLHPAAVFGERGPYDQKWRSDEWPADRLKALGGAYSTPAALDLYGRNGRTGRPKLSGMGPALVKLAALGSGQSDAIAIARSQGMPDSYGFEQLEKEHGIVSVAKAASHGVKGLNGEVRKVTLAEGSGQTGGYLIPPQWMNELLTIAGEDGFIEPRCKVVPMNSRSVEWPMLDVTTNQGTGVTPYAGGVYAAWQPEASTFNETEPAFRQATWTAWDLVLYCVSSNQLLADNGIGLDAFLTQIFAWAITWYREYAFLRGLGAGSSMPLGIINAPATLVQNRAVSNRFVLADAAAMLSHLQIRSWDDACWIMHQSVVPQLIQMASGAVANTASTTYVPGNQMVWLNPFQQGLEGPAARKLPNAFLNGLPVYFTEKLPSLGTKGDVMLADWSKYVVGTRLDLQIDVSPHFLFRTNQLAWRVISRCDGKPWLNSVITDAAGWTVSPMVVLN